MTTYYFTVDELAKRWRVSKMSVYRMVDAKEIDYVRIKRSIRVPAEAVLEYEERQFNA